MCWLIAAGLPDWAVLHSHQPLVAILNHDCTDLRLIIVPAPYLHALSFVAEIDIQYFTGSPRLAR